MDNLNENMTPNNETEPKNEPEKGGKMPMWAKEILDWVKAIAIAVAVALLLRTFVLTLALVDGASMENTLHHGDRLYVNKLFYTPQKGDIVIVETDKHPGGPLVKRVIATEGDTIYIDPYSYEVYVNDKLIEEEYIKGHTILHSVKDSLTGIPMGYVGELSTVYSSEEYSRENPIKLGKDEVFVMGDNRENSSDSRDLGIFKEDEVVGHVLFRFWPLSDIGMLD